MADSRERDLVLSPNAYVYVLDKTKGQIACVAGPYKMSLSNTDSPVVYNESCNRFEEPNGGLDAAIQEFVTAPENWYVALKNPTVDGSHPTPGTSNALPPMDIGKKINIQGPVSFALYPGQMHKLIRGHRLHSNQYLKARVYNAMEANKGLVGEDRKPYIDGEIIIIKGSDQPFYIPPTGIEVIPIGGNGNDYVRDAVTLENLEYCVLKKESGEKLFIHGPNVVFPKPDETFIRNDDDSFKFHAYELSDTSGIYVKVLMDYVDESDGTEHKAGEELFITGLQQRIYYPREEHAIISYGDRVMNHAIAIPKGEGRYVLDRVTGAVNMITGPMMFLPNPIDQVVVKRRLTMKQCNLWFPGSQRALDANGYGRDMPEVEDPAIMMKMSRQAKSVSGGNSFARGTSYTEPRTIELNNKYRGVVTIDVWTGYAVNIVGKDGNRRVVVGPTSTMLAYDETLESLKVSTGKPKNTDRLKEFVYLKTLNNKISDIISVQTRDFVDMQIKVSYCVDFLPEYQEKWFNVENYVKYLTDRVRSIMRGVAKKFSAEEFYEGVTEIIRGVILGEGNVSFVDGGDDKLEDAVDKLCHESLNAAEHNTEETAHTEEESETLETTVEAESTSEQTAEDSVDSKDEDDGYMFGDDVDQFLQELLSEGNDENINLLEGKTGMLFEENGMIIHDIEVLNVAIMDTVIGKRFAEHQDFCLKTVLDLSKSIRKKEFDIASYNIESELDTERNKYEKLRQQQQFELDQLRATNKALLDELEAKRLSEELKNETANLEYRKSIFEHDIEKKEKLESMELKSIAAAAEIEADKVETYGDMISDIIRAMSPELAAAMTTSANSELMQKIMHSMSPYAIANGESVVDSVIRLTRGTVLEQSVGELLKLFKAKPLENIVEAVDKILPSSLDD